ncbi:MAG: hypothetical protein A2Y07_01215 [Planctomycetes bacterium GWF2_50_10]|nr:MAG: hypothetical protein A2Y07_01215 [Planctomycetes bacterium GWF2_50_10]
MNTDMYAGKPLTLEEAKAHWPSEHLSHRKFYEGYPAKWLMLNGFPHIVRSDGTHASYFYYCANGEPIGVRLWQRQARLEFEALTNKQLELF